MVIDGEAATRGRATLRGERGQAMKINAYNNSVPTGMIAGLEVGINGYDFNNGTGPAGPKRTIKLVK
jgi:hypothetical protein